MTISARMRPIFAAMALAGVTLAAGPTRAAGVTPGLATPVQREQAQARFVRGKELFTNKSYAEALTEFTASLEIVASPNTRLYAARCYRQMGKLVEAYVELGRASVEAREHLGEDSRYVKTGEAADQERRDLAPLLGFVSVTVSRAGPETKLVVGDDEIRRAGWSEPIPVMPGAADIVLQRPNKEPLRQNVQLAAGEKKTISFDADDDTEAPASVATPAAASPAQSTPGAHENLRPYAYVAGGVGVIGLVTFVAAGALSRGTYNDLESSCHGPCPASRQSDIDAGKTQQTVANVGLIVGVIGAVAGVTLFVISAPSKNKPATAAFVASPSWIGLRGAF